MRFVVGLAIGLVSGWLIEQRCERRSAAAATTAQLREALAAASDEIDALRARLAAFSEGGQVSACGNDQLADINGIVKVYARRLHAAGVNNFADLASLSPERVREIISPAEWQIINPKAWIAEAAWRASGSSSSTPSGTQGARRKEYTQ